MYSTHRECTSHIQKIFLIYRAYYTQRMTYTHTQTQLHIYWTYSHTYKTYFLHIERTPHIDNVFHKKWVGNILDILNNPHIQKKYSTHRELISMIENVPLTYNTYYTHRASTSHIENVFHFKKTFLSHRKCTLHVDIYTTHRERISLMDNPLHTYTTFFFNIEPTPTVQNIPLWDFITSH